MKVGAGGLQVQTVHDEVANRQAQESRRTDYQQKPVNDSDNTEALNRSALNKTVEKPHDAAEPFDLPLRFPPKKEKNGQSGRETGKKDGENNNRETAGEKRTTFNDANNPYTGLKLDRYI